jgi:hypothetical protein
LLLSFTDANRRFPSHTFLRSSFPVSSLAGDAMAGANDFDCFGVFCLVRLGTVIERQGVRVYLDGKRVTIGEHLSVGQAADGDHNFLPVVRLRVLRFTLSFFCILLPFFSRSSA